VIAPTPEQLQATEALLRARGPADVPTYTSSPALCFGAVLATLSDLSVLVVWMDHTYVAPLPPNALCDERAHVHRRGKCVVLTEGGERGSVGTRWCGQLDSA
jgi:hypothetical protein